MIVSFFSFSCLLANDDNQHRLNDIPHSVKKFTLGWYDDHPGYVGEFNRILEYCKQYAKDVSPDGFEVNPILSDFGSMSE